MTTARIFLINATKGLPGEATPLLHPHHHTSPEGTIGTSPPTLEHLWCLLAVLHGIYLDRSATCGQVIIELGRVGPGDPGDGGLRQEQ